VLLRDISRTKTTRSYTLLVIFHHDIADVSGCVAKLLGYALGPQSSLAITKDASDQVCGKIIIDQLQSLLGHQLTWEII
jgi:hypothetical protein